MMGVQTELFAGPTEPIAFRNLSDPIAGLMDANVAEVTEHHFIALFGVRTAADVAYDMVVVLDAHLTSFDISRALLF